jgi:hypothetical protein
MKNANMFCDLPLVFKTLCDLEEGSGRKIKPVSFAKLPQNFF